MMKLLPTSSATRYAAFLLLLLPSCSVVQQAQQTLRPRSAPIVEEPAAVAAEEQESAPAPEPEDVRVEVLWDSYGVPHIFAEDAGALFYAFGWAQMRSHGDLLLRLYGQARGRAAEYWGERFVDSDTWILTNGVPARAERWLAAQPPHMASYLDAFVAGINAFAEQNPEAIDPQWAVALPVRTTDVLAHQQRVLHFTFIASPQSIAGIARQWQAAGAAGASGADAWTATDRDVTAALPGSNAWAVAPSRTAGGRALLLANPHLPWGDIFTLYEAHLVAPGVAAYGATIVGFPVLAMAFNDDLGWTHTVNTIDGADVYELTLDGDAYVFDGSTRSFDIEHHTLRVRAEDGSLTERPLNVRRSVHGPIIAERDGGALALRVAGLDAMQLLGQYWDMVRSTGLAQFEAALSRLQLPLFTVMYADRAGNILHVFNGAVPVRSRGDWAYWQGIVPGDSSATLWTQTHAYHSLPRVLNPTTGWLQNANDPPWTTTIPFPLDPFFFPSYMAPERPLSFRAQRSALMLSEPQRLTLEQLASLKHSTRMGAADHLVHDVVAAARAIGDPDAIAAADVLERWDRNADADSRGAILFQAFYRELQRHRWPDGSPFEIPWTARSPLSTPDGLSDPRAAVALLARAAQIVQRTHGSLDIAWGDIHRFRRDDIDLPANGGPGNVGVFRVIDFEPMPGDSTRFVATGGDSYIAAIEFARPLRARILLTYGNASQPGSPHRTDQLGLAATKQLRTVWLTRDEIMENLALREVF
jgi:acyl-homoserine-lactone acylase